MTESLAVQATQLVQSPHKDVSLTATMPAEMQHAQAALIVWTAGKIGELRAEMKDVKEAYDSAVKHKWASASLGRQVKLYQKRIVFYYKMKKALEMGYCIVPNFPITLFAVRTQRATPIPMRLTQKTQWSPGNKEQGAQCLPEGVGEYKNPFPTVHTLSIGTNDKPEYVSCANAFRELEFPISMSKAEIIDTTSRAMRQKVFDEIGICPKVDMGRRQDPIIIGRLVDPRPAGYSPRKTISFLLAWHLDTSVL